MKFTNMIIAGLLPTTGSADQDKLAWFYVLVVAGILAYGGTWPTFGPSTTSSSEYPRQYKLHDQRNWLHELGFTWGTG